MKTVEEENNKQRKGVREQEKDIKNKRI